MSPADPPAGGLVLANLDAERDFARTLGLARSPAPLSPPARAAATRAGLLLNAMASTGDVLALPCAPAPGDLVVWTAVPGLPSLTPERCHVLDDLAPPAGDVLAWAETEAVAAVRRTADAARRRAAASMPATPSSTPPRRTGHPLADALWALTPPAPLAAARANHRRVALAAAAGPPGTPPGGALFDEAGTLVAYLAAEWERVAAITGSRRWVVKAACSAAGRDRMWLDAAALDPTAAARAARFLHRHGEAVAEPWLDRTADAGCVGYVDGAGAVHTAGLHRQRVDGHGRFLGVDVPAAPPAPGDDAAVERLLALRPGEVAALRAAHGRAGAQLAALGYRGAFGVDAWRWRGADGVERWHALGEINARLSVGLVARVLVDRVAAAVGPSGVAAALAAVGVVRPVGTSGFVDLPGRGADVGRAGR